VKSQYPAARGRKLWARLGPQRPPSAIKTAGSDHNALLSANYFHTGSEGPRSNRPPWPSSSKALRQMLRVSWKAHNSLCAHRSPRRRPRGRLAWNRAVFRQVGIYSIRAPAPLNPSTCTRPCSNYKGSEDEQIYPGRSINRSEIEIGNRSSPPVFSASTPTTESIPFFRFLIYYLFIVLAVSRIMISFWAGCGHTAAGGFMLRRTSRARTTLSGRKALSTHVIKTAQQFSIRLGLPIPNILA